MQQINCDSCRQLMNEGEVFCRNCGTAKEKNRREPLLFLSPAVVSRLRKSCSASISFVDVIIVFVIVGVLAAIAIPNRRMCYRTQARDKACMANIRVITGAIEMYNMDNEEKISTHLDDPTRNSASLVEKKYLKSPLMSPERECFYRIDGDMTENGVISCDVHGTLESPIKQDQ